MCLCFKNSGVWSLSCVFVLCFELVWCLLMCWAFDVWSYIVYYTYTIIIYYTLLLSYLILYSSLTYDPLLCLPSPSSHSIKWILSSFPPPIYPPLFLFSLSYLLPPLILISPNKRNPSIFHFILYVSALTYPYLYSGGSSGSSLCYWCFVLVF